MKSSLTILLAGLLLHPLTALADLLVLTDTVDDATLTLSIDDTAELGSTASASINIQVVDDDVPLSAGDSIFVEFFEDDLLNDDEIFSTSFLVTAAEVAAGIVDRTFDVLFDVSPLVEGIGNTLEFFARALVDKDACGFTCLNDNPETDLAIVSVVDPANPPPEPPDGPTPTADLVTVRDSVDDATLTLSMFDEALIGSSPPTSIRIEVDSLFVPLTLGDSVLIELFEDDLLDDDLLFSTFFEVTADEVLDGFVDRTFDVLFDPSPFFPESASDTVLEIFARASVDKSGCRFFCFDDTPVTDSISVNLVADDSEPPAAIAEPATFALLCVGFAAIGTARRRRKA